MRLFDSTDEISNELVAYALLDMELFENIDILESIDIDYIEKLLNESFKDEYFAISIVSPIK